MVYCKKTVGVAAMPRPKQYIVELADGEVKKLKSVIRKKDTTRTLRSRCQILIDLDEVHGKILTHEQCAKSNGICMATVANTVKLYSDGGVDAVIAIKRSVNSDNAKRKMDGRAEAKIIEIACGPAPEGNSRWTLRLLEDKAKIELDVPVSKDTIGRALKKTNFDLTATTTGVSRLKKTQNL
jgi:transposase